MAITASWQHVISLITSLNMRFVVAGVPVVGCQYAQRCNCLNSRSQLKLIEIGAAGKAFAVAPSLFAAPNIVRIESDAEEIGWNETKLRSPDADQQMSALFAPAMIQRCHNCLPVNTGGDNRQNAGNNSTETWAGHRETKCSSWEYSWAFAYPITQVTLLLRLWR